jgi:hypothetical protein
MVCGMACVHATTEASDLCRFAAACTPTPSRAVSSRSSRTAGNFIAAPPTAAAGSAIHYRQDVDSEAEHATVAEHAPRQLSPTMRDCASGALFPQLRVALRAGCCTVYAGCTLVTICMMLQRVVCCTLDFARRMRTSACLGRARPVDFRVDFKFRSAIYAQARPSISIPDGMRVRVRADRVRPTSQFQSSASAGL